VFTKFTFFFSQLLLDGAAPQHLGGGVSEEPLRYASISRSLLSYNRSLLTLPHTSGMAMLVVGLFCAYDRSLLPYDRPLLTLMRTSEAQLEAILRETSMM